MTTFKKNTVMKVFLVTISFLIFISCKQNPSSEQLSAQQIVDQSIAASGGQMYDDHNVSYSFRDKQYESLNTDGKRVFKRITKTDSVLITDVKTNNTFERFYNDELITLPDSIARKYENSVNSVHYFSRLPFGLNDPAVIKELLGKVTLKGEEFYKLKVKFKEDNGGEDFEDVFLYWFDVKNFKPKYLAYEYHTDGGGIRFREAYNERFVSGIRFVDYLNLKPKKGQVIDFMKIDSLYDAGQLELLSRIELNEIRVTPSEN